MKLADKRLFTGFARDITERKRLEKEVLAISDREQGRIGQDLHDGLCQQLAGIALMSEVLEQKLGDTSKAAATRAGEIARHIREAITQTRNLARGISPVDIDAGGLMSALEELAGNIRTLFKVDCVFRCDTPVLLRDNAVSMHLFRIAQEAVSNAIKHGKARHIGIGLTAMTERIVLAVQDDGTGFAKDTARRKGMGLRIMSYRAGMIGGSLAIQKDIDGGTTVVCSVHKSATKAPAPKEP